MKDKIRENYLLYKVQSKKDPQAYAELYDIYVTSIYRFVYFKVSVHEDAEDLTADAFLKAWHYLTEHTDIRSFRAVIYRIARNLVIDLYRKRAVRQQVVRIDEEGKFEQMVSDKGDFTKKMQIQHDHTTVLVAINKLKEDYREVLIFKHVEGLSTGEIADILGKNKSHVRVTAHRAIKSLRKILEVETQNNET